VLGLIKFNVQAAIDHVLTQIGVSRGNILDTRADVFDRIAVYLNEHVMETLTVMQTGRAPGVIDANRAPRGSIFIRQEVHRQSHKDPFDTGLMYIDKEHFRAWLSENGGDIKNVVSELMKENIYTVPKSKKAVLSKDLQGTRLPQVTVIGVDLRHPRLAGILDDAAGAASSIAQPQLSLVAKP
jgi:hypothetical protein